MEGNEALKLEQTRLPLEHSDGADDTARIRVRSWDNLEFGAALAGPNQPRDSAHLVCACLGGQQTQNHSAWPPGYNVC